VTLGRATLSGGGSGDRVAVGRRRLKELEAPWSLEGDGTGAIYRDYTQKDKKAQGRTWQTRFERWTTQDSQYVP